MPSLNSIENALLPLGWNKARIKCLAAALIALLTTRSLNLKKIANLFPTNAKKDSAYKRLQSNCSGVAVEARWPHTDASDAEPRRV